MDGKLRLLAFEDPDHPGNSFKYYTGESCIEEGCEQPAGTAWSPFWCFHHNVERIKRISQQFDVLQERFAAAQDNAKIGP